MGIHKGSSQSVRPKGAKEEEHYNICTLLTGKMVRQFDKWKEEMDGAEDNSGRERNYAELKVEEVEEKYKKQIE